MLIYQLGCCGGDGDGDGIGDGEGDGEGDGIGGDGVVYTCTLPAVTARSLACLFSECG